MRFNLCSKDQLMLCRRSFIGGLANTVSLCEQLAQRQASSKSINQNMSDKRFQPIVVSGPSGGGKSTLLNRLFKEYPDCFAFSISHTTRHPRSGEQNGREYYFVTKEEMQKEISAGKFLEHAQFGGNYYGTSKQAVKDVQATGRICVLDVEIQGVKSIRKSDLNPRYIFVKPPSLGILEKRLHARGTETAESFKKRLDHARADMKAVEDEPSLFDHIIVNDDLDVAYQEFLKLFQKDLATFCQTKHGRKC